MVPLKLLRGKKSADYVNTGMWAKKAIDEAKRFCAGNVAASSEASKFTSVPAQTEWKLSGDAAYVHYTPNETIGGVEFHWVPDTGDVPLIADMSSTLLSRPIVVSKFGVIYAGAQKNIGPAGLVVVIVRDDLIGGAAASTPVMFDYKPHADNGSLYNTPPPYAWYLAGLVFQLLKKRGGLKAMAEITKRKAEKLYADIDGSDFYKNPVEKSARSWMYVPCTLKVSAVDKSLLSDSSKAGLKTLEGQRSVVGMRASIY